jgi:predicted transcriptional regulator
MNRQHLKHIRTTLGLSQKEMSIVMGYSEDYLRELENGRKPIIARHVQMYQSDKIQNAYKVMADLRKIITNQNNR